MQSLLFLLLLFELASSLLPPCERHQDSNGEWVNLDQLRETDELSTIHHHYYPEGIVGDGIHFSNLWLPTGCSIHRFTNETIKRSVDFYIENSQKYKGLTEDRVKITFIGDSVTRGLYCSIARILAGSEVFGPLNNKACGGPDFGDYVNSNLNYPWYDLYFFDGKLVLSFCFVTSFWNFGVDHVDWKVEWQITNEKPFAVVLNTGAWDFQPSILVQPTKTPGVETCVTQYENEVSARRAGDIMNATMRELGWMARDKGIDAIYRNNHYNQRFGTLCADEKLEAMLEGTGWEVLDTRGISKDCYEESMTDGLHIDRKYTHTVEEHKRIREEAELSGNILPGQLEMALAQSFLNNIFHDSLIALYPSKE